MGSKLVTATDIQRAVFRAVEHGNYDFGNLVAVLIAQYDIVGEAPTMTIDDIPHDEFWALVGEHDLTDTGEQA